jgi:hypothetical protein
MSLGSYDEAEHERREARTATVDADVDDDRVDYRGSVEFDAGGSAEALLDQFRRIKSRRDSDDS